LYSQGDNSDDDLDPDEIVGSHISAFEEVTRGDNDSDEENYADTPLRKLKIYDATAPKLTEFFSSFKPDVLLGALVNFARNNKKIDLQVEKLKYKAYVQMPSEEENIVDFIVEIQKVKQGEEAKDTLNYDSDDDECFETVSEEETSNQAY
jgi:hypothetical protein